MNKLITQIKSHCIFTTIMLLCIATIISLAFNKIMPNDSVNIALVYILALIAISLLTNGYIYGIISALFSVICVNFFFTYPHFQLNFTLTGYPITFIVMITITVSTCALTSHIKHQAEMIARNDHLLAEADKEKMRANLLRAVSHDLRTPLTSIIGSASSLIENNTILTANDKHEIATHIYDDANWLLNMVENLLSVTRIDNSNRSKVKKSMEAVEEVIAEAVSRFKKRYPDAAVDINVPTEFLMIPMDAMLIEQVIINLLENAIIHSHTKLPIELNISYDNDYVFFHVVDFGSGIALDKIQTIFDGTTLNTADSGRGMGIGLSICKSIILAHNGSIYAANNTSGAEFTFTLPLKEGAVN